jgi:hypothetical protein
LILLFNRSPERRICFNCSKLNAVFVLVFLCVQSAHAWDWSRSYQFACFQEGSRTPIKVGVKPLSYVEITWTEHPVRYDFVSAGTHLIAGRLYLDASLSESQSVDKEIEKILAWDFNFDQMTWITREVIIFDFNDRSLTAFILAGEKSRFLGTMSCVDL